MPVRTKKRHTEAQCTLAFVGPVNHAEAARAALSALGFVEADTPDVMGAITGVEWADASTPIPWREVLPPIPEAERPGRMLRAARSKEDLSQVKLAQITGIPQRHISEMEHGKRAIGKERAKKLAEALKIDYHVFL